MHRLHLSPSTCINEAWNFDYSVDSSPSDFYKDILIKGKPNEHQEDDNTIFCDFYKHFAIDIVAETVFHYPYPQITEKTIRPIVHEKMFILVAPPHTLSMLHEFGFRSFPDFINEDYDTIEDSHQRIKFIISELARISKFSIDEIRQTMLQYKDTLTHNHDHYHWLCNNEIKQIVNKI
jgi:hypothetical protein|tara:strand:+ start:241 stop:774 length:534 start_codon:yes stop_codon:yes gene_type:complete